MQNRPGTYSESFYTPKIAGLDDIGSSLITLEIDLAQYRSNIRAILDFAHPAKLICVVKANAYGFGVAGLLPILSEFDDVSLGVANADEALELKALGYDGRIVLLGYTHPKNYYQIVHSGCQLSAYRPENIPQLAEACRELKRPLELHIKIDTGMSRMGVAVRNLRDFIQKLKRYPQFAVVGLFSHLVDSGMPTRTVNLRQEELFNEAVAITTKELGYRPERHLANSAGMVNFPHLHLDSVRVGLLPFGIYPPGDYEPRIPIEPCFRLFSEVIDLHRLEPGDGVSYTHSFIAHDETTIATMPYGYADGLFLNLSNKAPVLIRGRRYPLVGNVTMDYVMADVAQDAEDAMGDERVRIGDEVVIIGRQRGALITIEEVAELAGTIPYEISCAWGRRVRRVYGEM